ncbi:MAG: cellulase family glycosylhydrolase [Myxococcota bacterium]|nr:cellulase family glycosylhydrolase [Myxococcota bacterium]
MLASPLPSWIAVTACALVGAGCLRQSSAPATIGTGRRPPLMEGVDGPVEETDRPVASFILDGEPFCFAGTNNYYAIFKSHKMVDDLLENTNRLGLKVIRIWAYLDRGSLDGTIGNVDGPGEKEGVYFQYWDPAQKRPAYNDGATGIAHLDYVLDHAKRLGIKVILVLTNNWKDFGGMDQYLTWYGLSEHELFYTHPSVVHAYKEWIGHLVHRKNSVSGIIYRDDPTIFGWELANEPRCANGGPFDHRSGCTAQLIVAWADEMSTFIKTIDPNHLVSVGDEGFFSRGPGYGYDGSDGVDHEALLAIQHIDFGTYHLYPDSWGQSLGWASQWIEDHIQAARKAGKPTLLEEYGVVARRDDAGILVEETRRRKAYPRWHELIQKRGGNGALFWMLAAYDDEHGKYPDYDHFVLYADEHGTSLITQFARTMPLDSQACRLYRRAAPLDTVPKSPFVTVFKPPGLMPQATMLPRLDSETDIVAEMSHVAP